MRNANTLLFHRARHLFLVAAWVLTAGCATVHNPDPLESLNRKTFALNECVDSAVLAPVGGPIGEDAAALPQQVHVP